MKSTYINGNKIILNPNCSEAVYRIDYKEAESALTHDEMEILNSMIVMEKRKYPDFDGVIEERTYFEYTELDLFLDYFEIPSQRNHWTDSATSEMDKKEYDTEMKLFCNRHRLPYKDMYDKRHMGDDYDGEIDS